MSETKKNIKGFLIISHIYTYGPPHKLINYLIRKGEKRIHFMGHPFNFANDKRSFLRYYENGRLKKKIFFKLPSWIPGYIYYLRDFILTFLWGVKIPNTKYIICFDGISTCIAYFLKMIGKTENLIFYTIDYAPKRFANSFMNKFYAWIDKTAVRNSDIVWNLSERMAPARTHDGLTKKYEKKQIVVPIGVEKIFKPKKLTEKSRFKIFFVGHLREKQGLENLIRSMPKVINKLPKVSLTIAGGGHLENKLKEIAKSLGLEKSIKFTGYAKDFGKIVSLMKDSAIGVAPYEDDDETFTKFADPTKPKDYLSCGLPVVISKVPSIAQVINDNKCGIAYEGDENLATSIIKLLLETKKLNKYRSNAYKLAKSFLTDEMFSKALKETERRLSVG